MYTKEHPYIHVSIKKTKLWQKQHWVSSLEFKDTIALIWLPVSLSKVKYSLGHAWIGLLLGFKSEFQSSIPHHFCMEVDPPGDFYIVKKFGDRLR